MNQTVICVFVNQTVIFFLCVNQTIILIFVWIKQSSMGFLWINQIHLFTSTRRSLQMKVISH